MAARQSAHNLSQKSSGSWILRPYKKKAVADINTTLKRIMKGQTDSAAHSGNGTANEVNNNINR